MTNDDSNLDACVRDPHRTLTAATQHALVLVDEAIDGRHPHADRLDARRRYVRYACRVEQHIHELYDALLYTFDADERRELVVEAVTELSGLYTALYGEATTPETMAYALRHGSIEP